ncbi:hypothetical protein BZA77DRAFT_35656 [Pyronema omphalodes]|nr:hypothetical protein BZA77DRAFT_35656 [Pyronema omphalodes]
MSPPLQRHLSSATSPAPPLQRHLHHLHHFHHYPVCPSSPTTHLLPCPITTRPSSPQPVHHHHFNPPITTSTAHHHLNPPIDHHPSPLPCTFLPTTYPPILTPFLPARACRCLPTALVPAFLPVPACACVLSCDYALLCCYAYAMPVRAGACFSHRLKKFTAAPLC